jgi:hypothetical protein
MLGRVRITPSTEKEFAAQIRASWQKAVESIIETGKLLTAARQALGHGKWQTMFEGPDKLPFGERAAEMLMKIARDPVLSNPKFISVLPASWGTLHIRHRHAIGALLENKRFLSARKLRGLLRSPLLPAGNRGKL